MNKLRNIFNNYTKTALFQASLLLAVASVLAFYTFYDKVNFDNIVIGTVTIVWITLLSYMIFGFVVYTTLLADRIISAIRIKAK